MKKRWRVLDSEKKIDVSEFPDLHEVAAVLFANRKISEAKEARAFLKPDWDCGIHDPFLFSGMRDAVARTLTALESGERITIHGDYDADGVTGSTVVITTLREIEKLVWARLPRTGRENPAPTQIDFYIPHRDKEGYGLRLETVQLLKDRGTSLLITVDCGIANVEEIAAAREAGMDVIVLDHHRFGDELPNAINIHPGLPNESYPFKHLAAVGVAWKFCSALITESRSRGFAIPEGWEKWLLDLVSIATVTDMVPLTGENRVLLTYGLKVLNKTRRIGLQQLIEISGRKLGEITARDVGFSLGPRINAAGRMDHAELALQLMMSESFDEAEELSEKLELHNRERQRVVEEMFIVAESRKIDGAISVLWDSSWSPSLVGLVAGRFLERTGKPCVAIGKYGDAWIGSGRSVASYDITEAVRRAGEGLLTRVGGHIQACGFSFVDDSFAPLLAERLRVDADERLSSENLLPELLIDSELLFSDLSFQLIETVNCFQPFGIGNPEPLFLTRRLSVFDVSTVGNGGKHLRLTLKSPEGFFQKFIGFGMGDRRVELEKGVLIDVVYNIGANEWNGRKEIQCKLVDFQ
ncbi:MAG: single-stranded-DNA-specific exonuclease RecJ [Patescibacteria group bacterium]